MTQTAALTKRSARALSRYNPQKGLKTVAIAEAAEKHFARAKDASKLEQAIRLKLEAQAEFVYWWDTAVEKAPGARMDKPRSRSATRLVAGTHGLPERYVIDRWRKRLNTPEAFEATYDQAIARYPKILEFESAAHVSQNTGDTEWFTPPEYAEAARRVMGAIDLDPATAPAANKVIQAAEIFTAQDDGLAHRWDGRVWMNPPYAQPLVTQFCEKLAASVRAGTVSEAVVLVNNATETQWFRALVDVAAAICFPTGRVRFWHPAKVTAAPLQGQAVLYVGGHVETFLAEFATFGFLARIWWPHD